MIKVVFFLVLTLGLPVDPEPVHAQEFVVRREECNCPLCTAKRDPLEWNP